MKEHTVLQVVKLVKDGFPNERQFLMTWLIDVFIFFYQSVTDVADAATAKIS